MSLWKMYNPYCIVYPELSMPRMHQSNRHSKRARGVLKHFNGADGAAGDGWLDLPFDVQQSKDAFQVCMDVSQFTPNELTVKVVDNSIVVEAKHEEREDDHGYISRHIVRRYSLPEGYEADKVVSSLSSDGVLTVRAPKPLAIESKERVVQIQQVGPAHLNVKHNEDNSDASEKPKENLPATKTA